MLEGHPGEVEIFLVASYYRNWNNLQPDGPLGLFERSYVTIFLYFDSLNCSLKSVAKPKNPCWLRKKNTIGVIVEQKEQGWLRMVKIETVWE